MENTYILISLFISFLWGSSTVIHKYFVQKLNILTIMFISTIVYTACLLLFAAFNQKHLIHDYNIINNNDIVIIALTSIITGFFANYLYFYVLKDHESSLISALIYSCPIFTLLLAYLLLNERVDKYGILGIIFVVFGVGFISLNNSISPIFPQDR